MNKLILLLLIFICNSCGSLKPTQTSQSICKQLQVMVDRDQSIRQEADDLIESYAEMILKDSKPYNMMRSGHNMRRLYGLYLQNNFEVDVAIKLFKSHELNLSNRNNIQEFLLKYYLVNVKMLKVDKENTKSIIGFIKKYGYPNDKGVYKNCDVDDVYLIFVHSVTRDKKLVRLIEKEYEKGRVPDVDYGWIKRRLR